MISYLDVSISISLNLNHNWKLIAIVISYIVKYTEYTQIKVRFYTGLTAYY